jgi:glycerol-3-phosphate acyltransferase PlsX
MGDALGLPVVACSEVIAMDDEPGSSVRKKKDSSLVRCAELVRDAQASSMVSAGNTGATMAAALLRMGRLPGVVRPCIATPIPNPGKNPCVMTDAGANAECTPEMLVQFAKLASAFAAANYQVAEPLVGLLSIGEESSKGTSLVKETNELLTADPTVNFFGNVEGRDLIPGVVDVVVTDGFTGNVALKTLEGAFKFVVNAMLGVIDTNEETRRAGETLFPYLHTQFRALSPDHHGGAMLLGLNGICVISHGSSNDTAIMNAIRIADEMHNSGVVNKMRLAIRPDQE